MSYVRVYVCVCVCVKGGGVAGQKHKRFIFAPSFCQHSRWALVLNAYTKLIKIQLGKKFSSLSNKYCKICRQADSMPRPLYRVNTANAFAFALASILVSFGKVERVSWVFHAVPFVIWLPKFFACVCVLPPPPKLEGSKKRIDRARRGKGRGRKRSST